MALKVYLKSYFLGEMSAPRKRESTGKQTASRCFCTLGATSSSQGLRGRSYRRAACLQSRRPEITQLESSRAGIQTQAFGEKTTLTTRSPAIPCTGPCCVRPCQALLGGAGASPKSQPSLRPGGPWGDQWGVQ